MKYLHQKVGSNHKAHIEYIVLKNLQFKIIYILIEDLLCEL